MLRSVRLSPTYSSTSLHESSAPKVASHSLILSPSSRLQVMAGLCYLAFKQVQSTTMTRSGRRFVTFARPFQCMYCYYSNHLLLGCPGGVAVEGDGPSLRGEGVSAAGLVNDVGRNCKYSISQGVEAGMSSLRLEIKLLENFSRTCLTKLVRE